MGPSSPKVVCGPATAPWKGWETADALQRQGGREGGREEGAKGQKEGWATVSRCPELKSRSPVSAWGGWGVLLENLRYISAQTKPSKYCKE